LLNLQLWYNLQISRWFRYCKHQF